MTGQQTEVWSGLVRDDTLNFMTGEFLGGGMSRLVYVFAPDPTKVLKVETGTEFQNVLEWETWRDVVGTKWARWFAPCYGVSAGGKALLMARTEPLKRKPAELPDFLNDFKPENFGIYRGRVVCHDYGFRSQVYRWTDRMKKVVWNEK